MNTKRSTAPLAAAAAAALLALSGATSPAAADGYVIGVSNTITGNGWREEMICSIKAQALVSGKVESLNIQHRNTDAAGQLEDIRNLVAAGVDALIVNPAGPDAVNAAIRDATNAGIPVVVVDQAVTEPSAYLLANNQEEYAYLGARWLVEAIGGAGKVVYMGGAAGAPADNDRKNGFGRAIAETNGAVEVVAETQTGWDQATGVQQINDIFASGLEFDGVWTSGIDNVIVDAFKAAGKPFTPIVGADGSGFVSQLVNEAGLTGAAVTNPASVGGAGLALALRILAGEAVDQVTLVTPELWQNATAEGKAQLAEVADPDIPGTWPLGITVPGWTDYTKDQILACRGPGE